MAFIEGISAPTLYNVVQSQTLVTTGIQTLIENLNRVTHDIWHSKNSKKEFEKNRQRGKERIRGGIKNINENIVELNKSLRIIRDIYDFKSVSQVKTRPILKCLDEIEYRNEKDEIKRHKGLKNYIAYMEKTLKKNKCLCKNEVEHKILKVLKILEKNTEEIYDINKKIDKRNNIFQKKYPKTLKSKYSNICQEIIGLYGLGYDKMALFMSGTLIERFVTDILKTKIKSRSIDITLSNLKNMRAKDKIGKIIKDKILARKECLRIKTIKIDRNILAHPSGREREKQAKKEARIQIENALIVIENSLKILK